MGYKYSVSTKKRIKFLMKLDPKEYSGYKEARADYNVWWNIGVTAGGIDSVLRWQNPEHGQPEWNSLMRGAYADGYNTKMAERRGSKWVITNDKQGGQMNESKEEKEIGRYLGSFYDKDYDKEKRWPGESKWKDYTPAKIKQECWKVDTNEVKECGKIKDKDVAPLIISQEVLDKVRAMMKHFPTTEWLAFLEEHDGIIDTFIVPKQKVSGGSVDVNPQDPNASRNDVGVIHSHNTMGAFFSGTDDEYLNSTYLFSIVVAKKASKLEFRGVRKMTLPCGSILVPEAEIEFDRPKPTIPDDFVSQVLPNIEERKWEHYGVKEDDKKDKVDDKKEKVVPGKVRVIMKMVTRQELEEAAKEFGSIANYLKREWGS